MGKINLMFIVYKTDIISGTEKTVLMLCRHINKDNFNIKVLITGESKFTKLLKEIDNIQVEIIPLKGKISPGFYLAMIRNIFTFKPKLIQLHLSRFYAPLFRIFGIKVIERLNMNRHNGFKYLLQNKFIDNFTSHFISHFIAVSEGIKEEFMGRGYAAKKLTVIYNGIELPSNHAKITKTDEKNITIGSAGRLSMQKGMDLLIKAVAIVKKEIPEIKVEIAGDGEDKDSLAELVKKLDLVSTVNFLGFRDDVRNIVEKFDLFIFPSRWEPFANTILEVMAFGTPILASNIGGNIEIIKDKENGFLFESENEKDLANKIIECLKDKKLLSKIATNAIRDVREYSVEKMITKHEKFYISLI